MKKLDINWSVIAGMAIAGTKGTVIANVLGYSYRTLQDRCTTDNDMSLTEFLEKERTKVKVEVVNSALEMARVDPKLMSFVLGTVFGMKDDYKREQDVEKNWYNRELLKIKQQELEIKKETLEVMKAKLDQDDSSSLADIIRLATDKK